MGLGGAALLRHKPGKIHLMTATLLTDVDLRIIVVLDVVHTASEILTFGGVLSK